MVLSVRLSVRHTREPLINGSRYRSRFRSVQQRDVSSFKFRSAVVILNDGMCGDVGVWGSLVGFIGDGYLPHKHVGGDSYLFR